MKKNLFSTAILTLVVAFFLSGCGVEYQYYHTNHRHSPEYDNRHHTEHERSVDVEIHH